MARRTHLSHIGTHLIQKDRHVFHTSKKMFEPFYQLFGGDIAGDFSRPCNAKTLHAQDMRWNETEQAEFIQACEQVRQVLQKQHKRKIKSVSALENIMATLKFLGLKYHLPR